MLGVGNPPPSGRRTGGPCGGRRTGAQEIVQQIDAPDLSHHHRAALVRGQEAGAGPGFRTPAPRSAGGGLRYLRPGCGHRRHRNRGYRRGCLRADVSLPEIRQAAIHAQLLSGRRPAASLSRRSVRDGPDLHGAARDRSHRPPHGYPGDDPRAQGPRHDSHHGFRFRPESRPRFHGGPDPLHREAGRGGAPCQLQGFPVRRGGAGSPPAPAVRRLAALSGSERKRRSVRVSGTEGTGTILPGPLCFRRSLLQTAGLSPVPPACRLRRSGTCGSSGLRRTPDRRPSRPAPAPSTG